MHLDYPHHGRPAHVLRHGHHHRCPPPLGPQNLQRLPASANLPHDRILRYDVDYAAANQGSIFHWSRDHRQHHKFSDTDLDPHTIKKGFFFSHVGWLLVKKSPQMVEEGRKIDVSDLFSDPVVMFQKKYYLPLSLLCCFVLPSKTMLIQPPSTTASQAPPCWAVSSSPCSATSLPSMPPGASTPSATCSAPGSGTPK